MTVAVRAGIKMQVPFFRYPHVFNQDREALVSAFIRTAESGGFIMQAALREFEQRLAKYCGVKRAIGVANATDGLEMNLAAAGVGRGDEVILVSHTMVATASAAVTVGAKPVFAEVGADHLMDPEDAARRITARTRAIMPTQLNGRTCDMDRIQALARRHNLAIVEDSAQGIGSRFRGRMAGSFGVAGVLSFYPAKILGSLGDGGAILTDNEEVAEQALEARDHGRHQQTGEVVRWGRNSRLDNLQAAFLSIKLDRVDEEIATRRRLAQRYHGALSAVRELVLPPPPDQQSEPVHYDTFQNYEIEAEDRDRLKAYLADRGVGTLLQWGGKGVHEFPALDASAELPRTEQILRRAIMLPMNTSLTDDEVDYVVECIRNFYAGR